MISDLKVDDLKMPLPSFSLWMWCSFSAEASQGLSGLELTLVRAYMCVSVREIQLNPLELHRTYYITSLYPKGAIFELAGRGQDEAGRDRRADKVYHGLWCFPPTGTGQTKKDTTRVTTLIKTVTVRRASQQAVTAGGFAEGWVCFKSYDNKL